MNAHKVFVRKYRGDPDLSWCWQVVCPDPDCEAPRLLSSSWRHAMAHALCHRVPFTGRNFDRAYASVGWSA